MTARPQDVALLPLPDDWDCGACWPRAQAYARANVTAALASAQAREEELRAEVERLEYRLETAEAYGLQCDADIRSLLSRAERLKEALREARDYVANELSDERAKFAGYEHCSSIASIEADLARIDAALSTNAATQTGETT